MDQSKEDLNHFLVEVFNEILKREEERLSGAFTDLSLRELHLIDEVCRAEEQGRDNRAAAIASAQRVTPGTLTTVVSALERKGYLERRRDERDRRAVRIFPTAKGRRADGVHARFHQEMVDEILSVLNQEEAGILAKALGRITRFFREGPSCAPSAR